MRHERMLSDDGESSFVFRNKEHSQLIKATSMVQRQISD